MSGASDNDDFDDENANPNTSHVSQPNASSTAIPVKKLAVPAEFFTCVGEVPGKNASLYRCLHPGCVPKKKRDGSEKPLVVYHSSRCNAKRHFLNHDPTKDLGHMKLWEDAVKHLDDSTSLNNTPISVNRRVIILQEDLDNWVLNFLIVDVLPIYTVEKPGFKQLVHTLVPNLVLHGRTFFTNKLETMYNERRLQLIDALRKSTDAATTIDAWTSRGKAYLGETIHWFDGESLKRRSACLGIRRIKERHTYDGLTTMIEDLHKEYEVVDKLRGATTDNGSNFFKAFQESGDASDVPSYEDDDSEQSDEEDNMLYFEIGNILDARIRQEYVSNNVNPTLPMHRKCTCYLLSLIAKADISKIADPTFQKLRNSTLHKVQLLLNKQKSSSVNSDLIMQHIGQLFIQKNETRCNSEYYAIRCIARLLRKKNCGMGRIFDELRLTPFTPNEEQFLKEYTRIMRHMTDALDVLQGEKNIGLGYLLPTISVLKTKLASLQGDASIIQCQPLITGLLDAISVRFEHMFSDNELRLATITDPFFKSFWLDNQDDIRHAKTLLEEAFVRFQGLNNESESSDDDDSSDGTSDLSPEKRQRRAKHFFASFTTRNAKSKVIYEVETFLEMCGNLDDLQHYPTIMKMYKRYNVTLPSCAAVEKFFSQTIFTAKRYQLTDKHFEMLLFLKVNNQMLNNW